MVRSKERTEQLLSLLAVKSYVVTAKELAREMLVSEKTIYRLVKAVNQSQTGQEVIEAQKGRGFRLNHTAYLNYPIQRKRDSQLDQPSSRQSQILERLLLLSPKSILIYDLAQEFFVGESAIVKDRLEIQKRIADYGLQLCSKKRALSIVGQETDLRRAIADLVPTFNTVDIDHLDQFDGGHALDSQLAAFVQNEIRKIENETDTRIPYPYNVNIFSHLYIMIDRAKKGVRQDYQAERSDPTLLQKKLLQVSCEVIKDIEVYLGAPINQIEVDYLYQYLISSRFQDLEEEEQKQAFHFPSQVVAITQFYIEKMVDGMSRVADTDSSLFIDLANHITPMLKRLEHKIRIKNKMLAQIKMTYPELFRQAQQVSDQVSQQYGLAKINQDEIGFLTLYFARFREMSKQPIRTVIMCTSGIGTSELLRSKIEKLFPDLEIVAVLSYRDMSALADRGEKIDLLVTTVDLPVKKTVRKVLVSAILTEDDKQRIRQKIEAIHYAQ